MRRPDIDAILKIQCISKKGVAYFSLHIFFFPTRTENTNNDWYDLEKKNGNNYIKSLGENTITCFNIIVY